MRTMTDTEARAFKAAKTAGRKDFDGLPEHLKWQAGDDLVLGCFSADEWSDICGHDEMPPKGWRTGFAEACDAWTMMVCG